jgi:hypothetical protein
MTKLFLAFAFTWQVFAIAVLNRGALNTNSPRNRNNPPRRWMSFH